MGTKTKKSRIEGIIKPGVRVIIQILITIALAVDVYLAFVALSGGSAVGCGPDSGCDKVLQSKYSKLFGVPVTVPAMLLYCSLFYFVSQLKERVDVLRQRLYWQYILPFSVIILGAGVWFITLQLFVLKSICPYCMVVHLAGITSGILILLNAPFGEEPQKEWQKSKQVYIVPKKAKLSAVYGASMIAVLVVCQIIYNPQTHVVTSVSSANQTTNLLHISNTSSLSVNKNVDDPSRKQGSVNPQTPVKPLQTVDKKPRQDIKQPDQTAPMVANKPQSVITEVAQNGANIMNFTIAGANFPINLNEVPIIGNPSAKFKILSLFDYTCHYCRQMHKHLMKIKSLYGDQIAIVSLPMPLDANCNPAMPRTPSAHINSCEYAKIGLAVWRANRDLHAKFEEFVFATENPPQLESVRQFAESLVGAEALKKSASDPWVMSMITLSTRIFSTNMIYLHQGMMPQVLIGTNLVTGRIQSDAVLREQIEKQFGLKAQL